MAYDPRQRGGAGTQRRTVGGGARGGGAGARGERGYTSRGAMEGGGGGRLGNRRDVTEKKEKAIYYSQLNFDETANDYIMTKMTFGTLILIIICAVITFFFNLGMNAVLGCVIAFAFWVFYFVTSLIMKPKMVDMPYKEKKNYWTYELTQEYKQRNVVLNDFKRNIAQSLLREDRTVLVDDVSVELMSFNPLIFDFVIRANTKKDTIRRSVPEWGSKFDCETGIITSTGINAWRVVYPREGKWETLAGKKVYPKDAVGGTVEPSIERNPIGIRTDNFAEVCIDNASAHTIVSGQSGYGKSNMFNMILVNQFPSDAIILFFDAKGVEAPAGRDRWFPVTCFEQASAWIDAILLEMSPNGRRKEYQTKMGNKKKFLSAEKAADDPDAVAFTPDYPPIIIAVDECYSWVNVTQEDGKSARKCANFLKMVAQKGRSFGITLLVASQVPKDAFIPSDVKSQADQYIAFQQSRETDAFAFGSKSIDYNATKPSEIPATDAGIGQFAFAGKDTNNTAIPVKGYFITADTVEKQAKAFSNKKKTNNPVVATAMKAYEEYKKKSATPEMLPDSIL